MKQYLQALYEIMKYGKDRPDRTGTGTRGIFGYQMLFDLTEGFPAVTTKKLAWKAMTSELLWFLEGSTDEGRLKEILYGDRNSEKSTIWTDNAKAFAKSKGIEGSLLGPIYGAQWRAWLGPHGTTIDQIANLVRDLNSDPYSRRHILNSWSVGQIHEMALPPCHCLAQFFVEDGKLSCQLYQRSADMFLGVPFNIASYSLLTHMFAQVCGLEVGKFIWTGGDCHIYKNHFAQVQEQLTREPGKLPKLWLNPEVKDIFSFTMNGMKLESYNPMPSIKAEMSV